ncbi:MAG: hypothetical protein IT362_05250 [Deltaproteobacteria bacterium]|nr:hypothetical protein [Deltaproteobacteria bacterium]
MKRVIVIDMVGEEGETDAVRIEAAPIERKREGFYAPAADLALETIVCERPSFETQSFYKTLFDEYFKR